MLPLGFWEIDALIDVLDAGIVDQDINSSEFLQGFLDDLLAVSGLGQIGKDIDGLSIGVFSLELFDSLFDFLIGSEAVENDIVSLGSKGVSDSETDSTERASNECHSIVLPI